MRLIKKLIFASIIGLAISLNPAQSNNEITVKNKDIKTDIEGDNNNVNNGVIINNTENKDNKNNRQLSLLDNVTVGSNKEYVDNVLGIGKGQGNNYTYFNDKFVIEVIYSGNTVKSLRLIPTNENFSKTLNISKFKNGSWEGTDLFLGNAAIGDLVTALNGNATEIDANMAGAGNMNCINYATYTYKIKLFAMGAYQKITVGYIAPPCVDNTGINYYITYPENESLLDEGVNKQTPSKLMQLKLNFIEIEETNEF